MPFLALLLLLAAQQTPPPPVVATAPYRPAAATVLVEPVAMMLAGFDSDGDGRITEAEAHAGVAKSFAASANGAADMGYIAFADWAERWLGDRNAVPSPFEIDRNGDNRITLDELQERMSGIFARFDADKDHILTHKELLTIHRSASGDRPFGEMEGMGRRGGRRPR